MTGERSDVEAIRRERILELRAERDQARAEVERLSADRDTWRTRHLETNAALVDALAAAESLRAQLATVEADNAELYREQDGIMALKSFTIDVADLARPSQMMRRRRTTLDDLTRKAQNALDEFNAIADPPPVVIDAVPAAASRSSVETGDTE